MSFLAKMSAYYVWVLQKVALNEMVKKNQNIVNDILTQSFNNGKWIVSASESAYVWAEKYKYKQIFFGLNRRQKKSQEEGKLEACFSRQTGTDEKDPGIRCSSD